MAFDFDFDFAFHRKQITDNRFKGNPGFALS
jgi:hypothetical protein